MKSFYIQVFGCQQNAHDAVRIHHILSSLGFRETDEKSANIIVAIACAVRQTAVDRVFGKIKVWGNKKIIVTGCVLKEDRNKLSRAGVSFWDIDKPEDLGEILGISDSKQIKDLLEGGGKYSASVPIMYGCNNFCSYCATPYTRGQERSRDLSRIVEEVKILIAKGEKEILLLGQNVNSYHDSATGKGFADLLETLNSLEGDFIISFTSNHPKDMSDDIIKNVATLAKIKKEIHLPIQSGSNRILKAMNRPYTREQYLKIIQKIRNANAEIVITTDVIVGFPGETEEDFQQTVDIFKDVKYQMAYINKYSPRIGTAAYKLGDPIPWSEKKRRWKILDQILKRYSPKFER